MRILQLLETVQRFRLDGADVVGSTPKEFDAFLQAEMQKWGKVIKDAGIKAEQCRRFGHRVIDRRPGCR